MQHPNEKSASSFFQPAPGNIKSKRKGVSALYNTLRRLMLEHSPLLANVVVEAPPQKEVIYLHFKEEPIFKIPYASYQFKSSHLTIHKHFHDNKLYANNGLDICHFTQIYSDQHNHTLVVHIFFNSQRAVSAIEVKEFEGARAQGNFKVLEITSEHKKMFFESSQPACEMLQKLANTTNEFYLDALDSANELERKLESLGSTLNESLLSNYVATANCYIAAIDKVNDYCLTHYDHRGRTMKEQVTKLVAHSSSQSSAAAVEQKDEDELKEPIQSIQERMQPAKNVAEDVDYQTIVRQSKRLKKIQLKLQTDSNNDDLVIETYLLVKEIKSNLLICSTNLSKLEANKIEKLKVITKQITNCPDLTLLFVAAFWKGDVTFLTKAYPFVSAYLTVNFLRDHFFEKIAEYKPASHEEDANFRQAFKFLHETCPFFRLIFNNHIQLLFTIENNVQVNLLMLAFLQNNFYCFKLALAYGMDPNTTGLVLGSLGFPTIFWLAILPHDGEYLKEAIAAGASYQTKPMKVDLKQLKHSGISHALHLSPALTATFTRLSALADSLSFNNAMNWCLYLNVLDSIKYFIPQLTIEDALKTFVQIGLSSNVTRMLGFEVVAGIKLAENNSGQTIPAQNSSNCFLSLQILSNDDTKREILGMLFARLTQITVELSEPVIEQLYQKIFTAAVVNHVLKLPETSFLFEVCTSFLLVRQPTIMNYQKLMQVFFYLKKFQHVTQIAEKTFDGVLKATPLYISAKSKLNPDQGLTSKTTYRP